LPEGVRVRVKNKGAQAHKRGRKHPKVLDPHFTTKIVPAVALKILDVGLSLAQLFQMRPFNLSEHPT
jgi:hypothetical protein